ncbi:M28 family peptidase [Bacteroidota bacterium]
MKKQFLILSACFLITVSSFANFQFPESTIAKDNSENKSILKQDPKKKPYVSAKEIESWVSYLASDEMRGRKNGSPEMKKSAEWLAERFKEYGLLPPPGQNNYFQEYEISRRGNTFQEKNVIGYIEGSDPDLKNEYIILTAHFDHVGVGRAVDGDSIYNGANDNAAGTVTLLGIAKTLKLSGKSPKRTLIFAAVSGEEMGMWGSRYYVKNPIFPLEKTMLNFNFEMTGHCTSLGRNKYVLTGPSFSNFDEILSDYSKEKGWTYVDTVANMDMLFNASDNAAFARIEGDRNQMTGIPAHTLVTTTDEKHIHRPWDEAKYFDYQNFEALVEFVTGAVLFLAETDKKIKWTDKKFKDYRK